MPEDGNMRLPFPAHTANLPDTPQDFLSVIGTLSGFRHEMAEAGIMPRYESSGEVPPASVPDIREGISAMQHDFASDCLQSFSGVFPGATDFRGAGDEPDWRQDEPV